MFEHNHEEWTNTFNRVLGFFLVVMLIGALALNGYVIWYVMTQQLLIPC